MMACYIAAIVHDYGHLGVSNKFLVGCSDPLALAYNDRMPLENVAVAVSAQCWMLLGRSCCNCPVRPAPPLHL